MQSSIHEKHFYISCQEQEQVFFFFYHSFPCQVKEKLSVFSLRRYQSISDPLLRTNKQEHANTESSRKGNVSVIFEKISKYESQRWIIKGDASQPPNKFALIRPNLNQTVFL